MRDRITHCANCLRAFWHTPRSHFDPDVCSECDGSLTSCESLHVTPFTNRTNPTNEVFDVVQG